MGYSASGSSSRLCCFPVHSDAHTHPSSFRYIHPIFLSAVQALHTHEFRAIFFLRCRRFHVCPAAKVTLVDAEGARATSKPSLPPSRACRASAIACCARRAAATSGRLPTLRSSSAPPRRRSPPSSPRSTPAMLAVYPHPSQRSQTPTPIPNGGGAAATAPDAPRPAAEDGADAASAYIFQ